MYICITKNKYVYIYTYMNICTLSEKQKTQKQLYCQVQDCKFPPRLWPEVPASKPRLSCGRFPNFGTGNSMMSQHNLPQEIHAAAHTRAYRGLPYQYFAAQIDTILIPAPSRYCTYLGAEVLICIEAPSRPNYLLQTYMDPLGNGEKPACSGTDHLCACAATRASQAIPNLKAHAPHRSQWFNFKM